MTALTTRRRIVSPEAILGVTAIVAFLQAVRVYVPLTVFHPGLWWRSVSEVQLGLLTLALFCAPLFAPLVVRVLGVRRALWLAFGGLALMRLALKLAPDPHSTHVFAAASIVCGLLGATLWARYLKSDVAGFVLTIFLGLALDAALNLAFLTWDYAWQPSLPAILIALIISAGVLYGLYASNRAHDDEAISPLSSRTLLALAAFLALHVILIHNPAAVASLTGYALPGAGVVVLACTGVGILVALVTRRRPLVHPLLIGVAAILALDLVVIRTQTGLTVVLALLAASTLSGMLLAASYSQAFKRPRTISWVLASLGASLLFLLLLLAINYLSGFVRLPLELWFAPPLAIVILLLTSRKPPPDEHHPVSYAWALAPLIGLFIPAALFIQPGAEPSAAAASLRVMTYNIHQGVDIEGRVAMEAQAATIESEHPDIVLLQEVMRGAIASGNVDTVGWLAQRLGMDYHYAAADRQFGNAILSRVPIIERGSGLLPRNDEMGQRTYVRIVVDVGGEPVTIISTHLDHQRRENRLPQVASLIDLWAGAPRTIIGGDLNSKPDSPEIHALLDAGLIDSQAATGNGDLLTASTFDPQARIDYILTSPGVTYSDFSRPLSDASDHLPVAITLSF
ncbi:MAG: endonuclease/exonuclease/phosphatase family protein [Anaerolineae bacterium]|nr:endonuclease/exonuclease/phosphatase family protein [Anaerolineae bacterium]